MGFIRRSAFDIRDLQQVRKSLCLAVVRNRLVYCCQVWAPQTVKNILSIERGVQRRATKFIMGLPYQTHVSYKDRFCSIGIIPLCYWNEYLDVVYTYKCIINSSDMNTFTKLPVRITRNTENGLLMNMIKCKTVTFQNFHVLFKNSKNMEHSSYYIKGSSHTIPCCTITPI